MVGSPCPWRYELRLRNRDASQDRFQIFRGGHFLPAVDHEPFAWSQPFR